METVVGAGFGFVGPASGSAAGVGVDGRGRVGRVLFVDGGERAQTRDRSRHKAVAELDLGADHDQGNSKRAVRGKCAGVEIMET